MSTETVRMEIKKTVAIWLMNLRLSGLDVIGAIAVICVLLVCTWLLVSRFGGVSSGFSTLVPGWICSSQPASALVCVKHPVPQMKPN